jgi:hypothetical protein
MKFRQTSFDAITIDRNGETQVVDFVSETISVDGVVRAWDENDRALFPTQTEIQEFIDIDNACNLARVEKEQRAEQLAQPLAPLPVEGSTVAEIKASADTAIADLAQQMQAKIDAIAGGV